MIVTKKHMRIIRIAHSTGTQAQQHASERLVTQVQAVVQLPLERGAVQEREEKVDTGKVEAYEVVDLRSGLGKLKRGLSARMAVRSHFHVCEQGKR